MNLSAGTVWSIWPHLALFGETAKSGEGGNERGRRTMQNLKKGERLGDSDGGVEARGKQQMDGRMEEERKSRGNQLRPHIRRFVCIFWLPFRPIICF